jgi:hypothetical protein
MTGYSKGGIVEGSPQTVRFVAECSPDGKGRIDVVFADECIIGRDRICTRTDALHAAVPGAVKNRASRWFICPLHDGGRHA